MKQSTKSIARSTMTRFWGDPGSGNQPGASPAPGGQAAAPGSGGVSAPAGVGASPAGGGTPSIGGAMQQAAAAAGLQPGATAAGLGTSGVQSTVGAGQPGSAAAGGVGSGQPGMSGAAAATPASFESVLASHPQLLAEWKAHQQTLTEAQRWVQWGQHQLYQQQQAARNPAAQPVPGQPTAAAQPANPFGIPQFNKALLKTFVRGQDGSLQPGPMTPPGAMFEYEQWQNSRMEALEGFLDDPMKYLGPLFQKVVSEAAPRAAQEHVAGVQSTAFANNYVAENGAWLFVQGANGQPQRDGFNRPVLSEHGQRFAQICDQLDKSGVKDIRMQQQLAEQIVFGQAAIARIQSSATATAGHQQQNGNLLSGAAAMVNGQNGQAAPNMVLNPQPTAPAALNGANPAPVSYGGQRQVRNRMLQLAQQNGMNLEAAAV